MVIFEGLLPLINQYWIFIIEANYLSQAL